MSMYLVLTLLTMIAAQAYALELSVVRAAVTSSCIFLICLDGFMSKGFDTAIDALLSLEHKTVECNGECAIYTLTLCWALLAGIITLYQLIRRKLIQFSVQQSHSRGYSRIGMSIPKLPDQFSKTLPNGSKNAQKTFDYPDSLISNYFDPDNLPANTIGSVASIIIPIAQEIARIHGFQIDNTRNQAEHVIMLLVNEIKEYEANPVVQYLPALLRMHNRLFDNYKIWCDRLGIAPLFMSRVTHTNVSSMETFLEDILIYFMIWGESGNLRHCPECLCFLFHKILGYHQYFNVLKIKNSRYPGHFLDMVVIPIYDVFAAGMKGGKDHDERKTYDDFNEFFWYPNCLIYVIYEDEIAPIIPSQYSRSGTHALPKETSFSDKIHIAIGLQNSSKTYVEKRSWLHPLSSLKRIFEWHVVTFTLLTTWAFSSDLQWTYAFTLQVGSFIFIEISLMSIIWTCLEVWTLYPHAIISGPSVYGYLVRLVGGYIVLSYQLMYYTWSFQSVNMINHSMVQDENPMFWWWQYFWLSVIALFWYFLEAIFCYYPKLVSYFLNLNNDLVQAILNICYPMSQVFVGKKVHVSQYQVVKYICFWIPLLVFKFWFGYRFIVRPVTLPSIELYDDYMNFQRISFFKTSLLMFVWWFPHFLVYLIDLSIWYSVWISIAGGFIALVERQGAVRDSRSFRAHFIRSPLAFSQRLLKDTSIIHQQSNTFGLSRPSTASLRDLTLRAAAVPTSPSHIKSSNKSTSGNLSKTNRAKSSADMLKYYQESSNLTQDSPNIKEIQHSNANNDVEMNLDSYLSNIGNQRWVLFARVWNEIVVKLRVIDHINTLERDRLLFATFDWLAKPVYLPLYQTAGCIVTILHSFKEASRDYKQESDIEKKILAIENFKRSIDVSTSEAVSEAWEILTWLLQTVLGDVHSKDVNSIADKINIMLLNGDYFDSLNVDALSVAINHIINISSLLKGNLKARRGKPVATGQIREKYNESKMQKQSNAPRVELAASKASSASASGKIKKSISVGFLQGLGDELNHASNSAATESKEKSKFTKLQPFQQSAFAISDIFRDKLRDELRNFLLSLKNIMRSTGNSVWNHDDVGRITFITSYELGFFWNDLYASEQLDKLADSFHGDRGLIMTSKLYDLLTLRQVDVELISEEAKRRVHFFINSLFMDIPKTPSVRYCKEYTTITPYYSEDVLLSRGDLEAKNSDGVSTLLYLQTLYKQDWLNFLERRNIKDEQLIWKNDSPNVDENHYQETRIWASLRSQTLYRTVEGMMYSEAAIRLLASLEDFDNETTDLCAQLKFNYVVACQVYGQMKKNLESKAGDIEFLLKRHPNLRVAYIDTVRSMRGNEVETSYYSVLIKGNTLVRASPVSEVYRVKLPGNPILGEGKPENQNHAIIFSRGRHLQAIDMNQEGYFEESLKMRNLLQEFDIYYEQYGIPCAILGFREHIFTGSVSSVANYMALQELSFVSLGQRVLNNPLAIRQHYGHPDVFDKFFVMTEGGMSKASRGINLSEDVFAGFNATIRGRGVQFKEYVHVGKGRDVGLQQTYKFEAKLSQGNAEQSISRDIDRICDRLDFFRLLSFYYGGIGHYVSNTLVMFTLVLVVYSMLGLAVFNEEGVNGRGVQPEGVLQLALAGMGVIQTGPLAVTLTVEKGFIPALGEIIYMMLSGGPLYFIFHIQTKCYYFQQTLMAGGAMYRPTGRGFVIRHSPFDENYRFFVTSHIYLGFELCVALLLLFVYTKSKQYSGLTWSLWMAAIAFLLGPFWFNPATFRWNKVSEDYWLWMQWMTETSCGSAEQSWESWWREDNSFFRNLSLSWKLLLFVQKCLLWSFISFGIFGSKFWHDQGEQMKIVEVLALFVIFIFGHWIISKQERRLSYAIRRFSSLVLSLIVFGLTIYLYATHLDYIRYTIAIYYFGSAISFLCLMSLGVHVQPLRYVYKIHDYIVGHTIFFFLSTLTFLQVRILFLLLLYLCNFMNSVWILTNLVTIS